MSKYDQSNSKHNIIYLVCIILSQPNGNTGSQFVLLVEKK